MGGILVHTITDQLFEDLQDMGCVSEESLLCNLRSRWWVVPFPVATTAPPLAWSTISGRGSLIVEGGGQIPAMCKKYLFIK